MEIHLGHQALKALEEAGEVFLIRLFGRLIAMFHTHKESNINAKGYDAY